MSEALPFYGGMSASLVLCMTADLNTFEKSKIIPEYGSPFRNFKIVI
jgi:hypothetical protein